MMNSCTSCGRPIPQAQGNSCSMCYGDIDYGSDGYYREWVEKEERRRQEIEEAMIKAEQNKKGG